VGKARAWAAWFTAISDTAPILRNLTQPSQYCLLARRERKAKGQWLSMPVRERSYLIGFPQAPQDSSRMPECEPARTGSAVAMRGQ